MKTKFVNKLTTENQVTIPHRIREVLSLSCWDSVAFKIDDNKKVFIRKAAPMDCEYIRALEGTLSEWSAPHDEAGYGDL